MSLLSSYIKSGRLRVFMLILSDIACLFFVGSTVVFLYWACGFRDYELRNYLRLWPVICVFTAFNVIFKLYQGNLFYPSLPLGKIEEFRRLIGSSIIAHLAIMAFLGFSRHTSAMPRIVPIVSGLGVALLSQTFRNIMRAFLKRCNICQIDYFLLGENSLAKAIVSEALNNDYLGIRIVGHFSENGCIDGVRHLGGFEDIIEIGHQMDVKRLLVCEDLRLFKEKYFILRSWFTYITYFPVKKLFPVFGTRVVAADTLGGIEFANQLRMKGLRWEKNIVDFVFTFIIAVASIPLFIIIPIMIKLTSSGPVFYRHRRLGKGGREFYVWKFRTMYTNGETRLEDFLANNPGSKVEWEKRFKLKNDPRITPFGRILRKTSLDELPQIINVFRGEMSVVGPRPITEEEKHYYGEHYDLLKRVKPGITGLWQCSGRSETSYERRVALDNQYILNWSPWIDLWVMFNTIGSICLMRGAR